MRFIKTVLFASMVMVPALVMAKEPSAANAKMQQCAAAWQQMKTAGTTNGQDYKTYSSNCLKADASVTAADVTPQNKMKACADKWNELKASNGTNGQTYKSFSAECLKK